MQAASFRIRSRVAVSISYHSNYWKQRYVCLLVGYFMYHMVCKRIVCMYQFINKSWLICLHQFKKLQVNSFLPSRLNRREETTLTRLRIEHIRLNHSFILKEVPPPKCPCGNQYSFRHILIECTKLNHIRKKFYKTNSMKELFSKIALKNIINIWKAIGLLKI